MGKTVGSGVIKLMPPDGKAMAQFSMQLRDSFRCQLAVSPYKRAHCQMHRQILQLGNVTDIIVGDWGWGVEGK